MYVERVKENKLKRKKIKKGREKNRHRGRRRRMSTIVYGKRTELLNTR